MRLLTILVQVGLVFGFVFALARLILDEMADRRFWRKQLDRMQGRSAWKP